jgi:hypothetical protein
VALCCKMYGVMEGRCGGDRLVELIERARNTPASCEAIKANSEMSSDERHKEYRVAVVEGRKKERKREAIAAGAPRTTSRQ